MKYISLNRYKKILFLGDSITQIAQYVNYMDTYLYTYFREVKPVIINLGLSSETVSGLSEAHHPFTRPCIEQRLHKTLELVKPDLVIACYGMNDGIYHPFSEERFAYYKKGILRLVEEVNKYESDIILLTPPPFDKEMVGADKLQGSKAEDYGFMKPYENYNEVIKKYGEWLISKNLGQGVVDIFTPVEEMIRINRKINLDYCSGDGIHVNRMGHFVFTKVILKDLFNITLQRTPNYVEHPDECEIYQLIEEKNKLISHTLLAYIGHENKWLELEPVKIEELALEVQVREKNIINKLLEEKPEQKIEEGEFRGYKSYRFYVEGRECVVVEPIRDERKKPWVWRMEFFDAFSYVDMELLKQGWHIAYCNVSDMYGCEQAIEILNKFHNYVVSLFDLKEKADVFGFSRGGTYAVNYASKYPEHTNCLYLDAPVIDLCSWPGGLYTGIGSASCWKDCLKVYKMSEEQAKVNFKKISHDHIDHLISEKVPVILVVGDADEVVPYIENGELLARQYEELGGKIKVIVKKGIGHHPHSLEEPKPIVDFIKNLLGDYTR